MQLVYPPQKDIVDALGVNKGAVSYAMLILRYAPAEAKGETWDWEKYEARQRHATDAAPIEGGVPSQKQMAENLDVGHTRIGYAMLILRYAPAEAKKVMRSRRRAMRPLGVL